jgi:hypothetical protein
VANLTVGTHSPFRTSTSAPAQAGAHWPLSSGQAIEKDLPAAMFTATDPSFELIRGLFAMAAAQRVAEMARVNFSIVYCNF